MSKSILVINTPQKCEECQLCKNYMKVSHAWGNPNTYEVYCAGIANRILTEVPKDKKPDWCPLKDIPLKKNVRDFNISPGDFEQKGYQQGWNACIDEILGNSM